MIGAFEGSPRLRKFEPSTVAVESGVTGAIDATNAFNRKTLFKESDIGFMSPSAIGGGSVPYNNPFEVDAIVPTPAVVNPVTINSKDMFKYRSTNTSGDVDLLGNLPIEAESAVDVIPTVSSEHRGLMDPSMLSLLDSATNVDSDVEIDALLNDYSDLEGREEFGAFATIDECMSVDTAIEINAALQTEKIATGEIPPNVTTRLGYLPYTVSTNLKPDTDYIYGGEIHTLRNLSPFKAIYCGYGNVKLRTFSDDIVTFGCNSYGDRATGDTDAAKNPLCTLMKQPSNKEKEVGIKFFISSGLSTETIIVYNDDSIYVAGQNHYGCLGLGHTSVVPSLTQVPIKFSSPIKKVVHVGHVSYVQDTCILLENGDLYFAGYNGEGQFGTGYTGDQNVFVKSNTSALDGKVVDVYMGHLYNSSFSYAITDKGSLYCTGYNGWSSYFDSTTTSVRAWKKVDLPAGERVRMIYCNLAGNWLITDKNIWTCGRNDTGALGDGSTTNRANTLTKRLDLPFKASEIKKIQAHDNLTNGRDYHGTHILLYNGDVWCTGYNGYGVLGVMGNDQTPHRFEKVHVGEPVLDIACGHRQAEILTISGKVYSAGDDAEWRLGVSGIDYGDQHQFVRVPDEFIIKPLGYSSYNPINIETKIEDLKYRLWPKY